MNKKSALAYLEVKNTGRLNSDYYTLADFNDLESDDIFDKALSKYWYIYDYKEKGYYTHQRPLITACDNRVLIKDPWTNKIKEMIMMGSNNYLGLTNHPKVIEAGIKATEKYGAGPGSVPLFAGTYNLTQKLEKKLAALKGCEDAVIFPSGYTANIGTINALLRSEDVAIIDKLAHASIIDGCKLSGTNIQVFHHQNIEKLEKKLKLSQKKYRGKLIIVDGVYSMHGDICLLPEIKKLADMYNARIMVDDAHATGVIGKNGKGTADYYEMEGQIDIVTGTLSKALGGIGGFLASTKEVVEYVRLHGRSFFFSTALPPAICSSLITALEIIEDEPDRREKLHKNVKYIYDRLSSNGLNVTPTESAILGLVVGEELTLRKMSKRIHELGLYINPVPFPAVPKGHAKFRISPMATHSQNDIDEACDILEKVCYEFNAVKSETNMNLIPS
ncbi:MAG: pyridoxal phosphate-dependent aminotransferase family protein [Spirochaetes bacterium]|nr:pyridoxal phosphate-dependent aminotransferase family protein [Spirochaetota bacterium]